MLQGFTLVCRQCKSERVVGVAEADDDAGVVCSYSANRVRRARNCRCANVCDRGQKREAVSVR